MRIFPGAFPAYDTVNNKNVRVLHIFEPISTPLSPAAAQAYAPAPTTSNIFALVTWEDDTIHIQTMNNLTYGPH